MTASISDCTGLPKHAALYLTYSIICCTACLYETFPFFNNYSYRHGSQKVARFFSFAEETQTECFIYLKYCNFYKEDLCLILRSIMLFSSVNVYRIIVIELSRYGHLVRPITFLLCNHENVSWSCELGVSSPRYLNLYDMENLFPDPRVWMTQSTVRAGYDGESVWMFMRGQLLTCKLIIT